MKIAVVGGGITGSLVASELAEVFHGGIDGSGEVVLFDQGRRGPGGRASHRSVVKRHHSPKATDKDNEDLVEKEEFDVLPDDDIDESAFQFDHGCKLCVVT